MYMYMYVYVVGFIHVYIITDKDACTFVHVACIQLFFAAVHCTLYITFVCTVHCTSHLFYCSTSLVEEGNVVRLRGLPYQADMKNVASFLSGLNIIP